MPWIPVTQENVQSGGGAMTQLYDNIAAGAIASWDVSSGLTGYNHLKIVLQARGDTANPATSINLRFNNDSGANYSSNGSGGEQIGVTLIRIGACPAATGLADSAGIVEAIVPNYASTTFKKNLWSSGGRVDALSGGNVTNETEIGFWNNTAAITRITIAAGTGNFVAGSRLTIYGLL